VVGTPFHNVAVGKHGDGAITTGGDRYGVANTWNRERPISIRGGAVADLPVLVLPPRADRAVLHQGDRVTVARADRRNVGQLGDADGYGT
jgi:hypothetical protein